MSHFDTPVTPSRELFHDSTAAVDRLDAASIRSTNQRDALYAKALVLTHSDKSTDAIEVLNRFMAEARDANDMLSWAVVEAETLLGHAQEQNAQERKAAESYRSALARAEQLPEKRSTPSIVLFNNYGRLLHQLQ